MFDNAEQLRPHMMTPVLFVFSHMYPVLGIERAALALLRKLGTRTDLTIEVVCIGEDAYRAAALWPGARTLGSPLRGWRRIRSLQRARQIGDFRGPIVLVGAWAAIPTLFVLHRSARRRTIIWEHSFDDHKIASSRSLRILRALARHMYGRAEKVIVVSSSLAKDVSRWLPGKKISVIANVVDMDDRTDRTRPRPPARTFNLVSIGSLTKTKNQQLAIRAMAELPGTYSLQIVGDGPTRPILEKIAHDAGVAERVEFCGYVDDVNSYLISADVLVHPALGETFGLALFEAAAFHRPVVAIAQSTMRGYVPEYVPGLTVSDDPRSFAAAIRQLVEQPLAEEAYEAADVRRREKFGSDTIAAKWADAIMHVEE